MRETENTGSATLSMMGLVGVGAVRIKTHIDIKISEFSLRQSSTFFASPLLTLAVEKISRRVRSLTAVAIHESPGKNHKCKNAELN